MSSTLPLRNDRGISPAEWAVRVDLAAAYRAAAIYDWNQGIYNHFTCRVPGEPDCYLVKRHGDMFDEVTASSLVKVDMSGRMLSFEDDVNPAAFAIHTAILRGRPEVNATLHLHTPQGIAVSARPEGFLYINQESAFFYDRISYYGFDGIEERPDDTAGLERALAAHHHTLILRNHGIAMARPTIQGAFIRMQNWLVCAQAQLLACAGPTPPLQLDERVCRFTCDQYEAQERRTGFVPEWKAVLRMVDRKLPGYAD